MPKRSFYFSKAEILLWTCSVVAILISFFVFDRINILVLFASLIGVTSLLLNAKGNLIGQALMIVFSIMYGIVSYSFAYYGEMITYLGMTLPMSLFAFVSWLRHPYHGKKHEVAVNNIKSKELLFLSVITAVVTTAFYFILKVFHTTNLIPSTLSVTTSFLAVYLTFRRSPFFALAYAANDIVLIVLWILASIEEIRYVSVVICFVVFLLNDIYGFVSWLRMKQRQRS